MLKITPPGGAEDPANLPDPSQFVYLYNAFGVLDTVQAGETVHVKERRQWLVVGGIVNDGVVVNEGEVAIV
jgi:hypothetical protein